MVNYKDWMYPTDNRWNGISFHFACCSGLFFTLWMLCRLYCQYLLCLYRVWFILYSG